MKESILIDVPSLTVAEAVTFLVTPPRASKAPEETASLIPFVNSFDFASVSTESASFAGISSFSSTSAVVVPFLLQVKTMVEFVQI